MPMTLSRRSVLAAAATLGVPGWLHAQHLGHHQGQFEQLKQPGRVDLPEAHAQQAVTESPAPRRDAGPVARSRAVADPAH